MKWQLIFLVLFLFPVVMGLDYYVTKINDCTSDLNISVSANLQIDNNEYSLKDCSLIQTNQWNCNCSNPIILSVKDNTVNHYTFLIEYISQTVKKETKKSSGGGGGSSFYYIPYNTSITNISLPINSSEIDYTFFNITNEYKSDVYEIELLPNNYEAPVANIPVIEIKKSIWERFWETLIELLYVKLW